MKGEKVLINGDRWTIVDVAPAMPLAEMVATILEDEGMITTIRGAESFTDVLSHLGLTSAQATYVLVPEADGERAMAVIAETVTDFEGDELAELLERMERGEVPEELMDAWGDEAADDETGEDGEDGAARYEDAGWTTDAGDEGEPT
jgi:hypothetical protein